MAKTSAKLSIEQTSSGVEGREGGGDQVIILF